MEQGLLPSAESTSGAVHELGGIGFQGITGVWQVVFKGLMKI